MNYRLPYSPTLSKEWLQDYLDTNCKKLNYNRFMWWRSYTSKNKPLTTQHRLPDRILNGDFDPSHYKFEADLVEHRMNEKFVECHPDSAKFIELTSLDRARRKRLLEDHEKDEGTKLHELKRLFIREIKMTREDYENEIDISKADTLIEFYYEMVEKYGTYWKPLKYPK